MKTKKVIKDKTVYGGMYVDKYFLHFEDGTNEQVNFGIWDQLEVGDEYIVADVPDSFVEAMKDIVKGKTVPLDKALNEKPSNSWEELFDMQTKLVTHYVLENEKLKDRIKQLEAPSEKVDNICNQIEEIYKERDYYKMHSHILETANDELDRANKLMKDTLINIWECFEIRSEIYHNDWVGLQALANKARICLEEIGYEWRNDNYHDNKS
jgi:hypothetical protein